MTLPNDRGLLCPTHSREGDEQQERDDDEEGGRGGVGTKVPKLQECNTDDYIVV